MTLAVAPDREDLTSDLLDELVRRRGAYGQNRLRRLLNDAIADLSGSVHREALAEMATRLVLYRLDEAG